MGLLFCELHLVGFPLSAGHLLAAAPLETFLETKTFQFIFFHGQQLGLQALKSIDFISVFSNGRLFCPLQTTVAALHLTLMDSVELGYLFYPAIIIKKNWSICILYGLSNAGFEN